MAISSQHVAQKLETLRNDLQAERRAAGDVASGVGKAGDEPGQDRITNGRDNDGRCRRCGRRGARRRGAARDDGIELHRREFLGTALDALAAQFPVAANYDDVLAFDIAAVAQPLRERFVERRPLGRGTGEEHADADGLDAVLRAGHSHAGGKCDCYPGGSSVHGIVFRP